MKKQTRIEGYDYCELVDYFKLSANTNAEKLGNYLMAQQIENNKIHVVCRKFLDKFINNIKKEKWNEQSQLHLWKGLAKIKDGDVFMQHFITLLPEMWL